MMRGSWKNILFNISLCLNCLLIFLFIFEDRLSVPVWLQVAGRTHPLVLHFPIVLVVMYVAVAWFMPKKMAADNETYIAAKDILLLLSSVTAAITALAGLFLSREEGYDATAIQGHKWSGIGLSGFLLLWYGCRKYFENRRIISAVVPGAALFLIIFTGHQGSVITHGEGFILAPARPEKKSPPVAPEEARVFAHLVKPILEEKCITCHNARKAKGELIMETEALLMKGGKSGPLWDSTAEDFGLMLRRIHLPLDAKKHMPPQGKPQLTDDEIEILAQWIRKGADFKLKVADLPEGDTLKLIASRMLLNAELAEYEFDEADASTLKRLNTVNRVVSKQAASSPALSAAFFNPALFQAQQLKELLSVKAQLVSLDLSRMPVTDEDLKTIAGFENLRKLNLNFTGITGAALHELKKLKHLRSLSLSGTYIQAGQLALLKDFPQLRTVYAWNTPVTNAQIEKLQPHLKNIRFETGYKADTMMVKLSPPVATNEKFLAAEDITLRLKHYIKGTTIRFTLDGSDPDSIRAPIYYDSIPVYLNNAQVKARAFKPGWISSDVMEVWFYRSRHRPDSLIYLAKPNPQYAGDSAGTLIDLDKGETNFRIGRWVGFRENRMECLLPFSSAVAIESVALSSLVDVGSYIMPPARIEVWGGDDIKNMRLLGKWRPAQPERLQPSYMRPFECTFEKVRVRYVKVVAVPVAKLPAWHPGKGDKAWIFVDEILIN